MTRPDPPSKKRRKILKTFLIAKASSGKKKKSALSEMNRREKKYKREEPRALPTSNLIFRFLENELRNVVEEKIKKEKTHTLNSARI